MVRDGVVRVGVAKARGDFVGEGGWTLGEGEGVISIWMVPIYSSRCRLHRTGLEFQSTRHCRTSK